MHRGHRQVVTDRASFIHLPRVICQRVLCWVVYHTLISLLKNHPAWNHVQRTEAFQQRKTATIWSAPLRQTQGCDVEKNGYVCDYDYDLSLPLSSGPDVANSRIWACTQLHVRRTQEGSVNATSLIAARACSSSTQALGRHEATY